MAKKILVLTAFALLLAAAPRQTWAGTYGLSIKGALLNQFGGNCGDNLGDTYDSFCPKGGCGCLQYDDPDINHFSGNLVGSGKSVTVHFTTNGGTNTGDSGGSGHGCRPVFGEVQLDGTKDTETLYFNGSMCYVLGNDNAKSAVETMVGGWEIHSSSHNNNAFGSFKGKFQFNKIGFSMAFKGQTQ